MLPLFAATTLLAGSGLINLLIVLLVFCIVAAIVFWIISLLPLPSPVEADHHRHRGIDLPASAVAEDWDFRVITSGRSDLFPPTPS